MRVPRVLLDKTATVETPKGNTPAGLTYDDPRSIECHYEDSAALVIDERTTGDTAGQQVQLATKLVAQLDRRLVAGTRVTLADGTVLHVVKAKHGEHRQGPSNTELGMV